MEEEDQPIHYGPVNTWDRFASTQTPWMQKLLERIHFWEDFPNPFEICNECEINNGLLAILDGSMIIHNMSYGWVVAIPNGKS